MPAKVWLGRFIQQLVVRRALKTIRSQGTIRMPWRPEAILTRTIPFLLLLPGVFFSACTAGPRTAGRHPPSGKVATVYVVHHGTLHTGLTVKRSDIPDGHWPASADYGRFKYIEIGWGDDDGYRKPLTAAIALKALAGSKRTVLLVDGFGGTIRQKYTDPKFTVLAVDLDGTGLVRLCDYIQETYALDKLGHPIPLGGGWYRARGTYSAFYTCNTWIAAGLRKAGCPINPAFCSLPRQLLGRVGPFSRPLR